MVQQIIRKFGAFAVLGLLLLAGCGDPSTTSSTPTNDVPKAATGTVNLSVQFPQAALHKALIDERTTSIQVMVHDDYYNTVVDVTLVPDATTGIATATMDIPVGNVRFTAWAYEQVPDPYSGGTMDQELEMVETAGNIIKGENTVIISFLTGDWQFVDASDNPVTMTVGGTGIDVPLAGFNLSSAYSQSYAAKAGVVDYTKPSGWGDYALRWFQTGAATTPIGPSIWAGQTPQFIDGAGNVSAFSADSLNLTDPARSENISYNYNGLTVTYAAGDRLVFFLDSGPESSTDVVIDDQGNPAGPAIEASANSRVIDGSTLAGNLLEMTFESRTSVIDQSGIDCAPYWNNNGNAAAAKATAIRSGVSSAGNTPAKAAIGGAVTLMSGLSVTWNDCTTGTDVDGDGDFRQEYLTFDANGNGIYEPADGDSFYDMDNDGVFDQVTYVQVDGDGDGDMTYDYLSYDANHNYRYDAADGDTYTDYDNDGHFDYVYDEGTLYAVSEVYSDIVTREYRAKGQQLGTLFQPISAATTFVQYRTFENAANNRYQGYIDYKSGSENIGRFDVASVQLKDPSGIAYDVATSFYSSKYLAAQWDATQSDFGASSPSGNSGYSFNLTGLTVDPGDYTFSTTLTSGQTLDTVVNVPTQVALPVVASASMTYMWNADNSLTLSWAEPTAGSFDQYRIVLSDQNGAGDIFYGKVAPGTTEVTLSASLLAEIAVNAGLTSPQVGWVMQTRNYTGTNNYARGISGGVVIEPPAPKAYSQSSAYVQYRTYEDPTQNRFQGWVDFRDNGQPIPAEAVDSSQLLDPAGYPLIATPSYYYSDYLSAGWDAGLSGFGPSGHGYNSGFSFNLSSNPSLSAGDYTYETLMADGTTLTSVVAFAGQVDLPVVASTGMLSQWETDGSLTLSWAVPTGSFEQYKVVLSDPITGGEIFYGTIVGSSNSTVTLSATLIQDIRANAGLDVSADLNWVMQTRNNLSGNNYARGISDTVVIAAPAFDPATAIIGAWEFPTDPPEEKSVLTFLDATHYIMAEEGAPETDPITGLTTGGPGMEYGSYAIDAVTGDTTFSVIYDTTGDWGPAGTESHDYNITLLGQDAFRVTSLDPLDPFSMDLSRLSSDAEPIVGSWAIGTEATGMQVVTFFSSGTYLVASFDPSDATVNGMERGTYIVQPISDVGGVITLNIEFTGISSTLAAFGVNDVVTAPGTTATIPVVVASDSNSALFDSSATFTRVK